jgi:regulator of RNase E activity RraA
MAARMAKLGAKGILVNGRVRDLSTLRGVGVPVWSSGTSIIGAGAETKAWSTNVPIAVGATTVEPVSENL